MISLQSLFEKLATALDGELPIEVSGRRALLDYADRAFFDPATAVALPHEAIEVMKTSDAHPCCEALMNTPLPWAPPETTNDPDYIEVSKRKFLVELIGPAGLVPGDKIRMGVYGMQPNLEYGIRTHPAEEIFIMLAGRADWLRDTEAYAEYGPGTRRHHPSMMRHATRTRDKAFMSIYVWNGDVSFDSYVYSGVPKEGLQ